MNRIISFLLPAVLVTIILQACPKTVLFATFQSNKSIFNFDWCQFKRQRPESRYYSELWVYVFKPFKGVKIQATHVIPKVVVGRYCPSFFPFFPFHTRFRVKENGSSFGDFYTTPFHVNSILIELPSCLRSCSTMTDVS